MMTHRLRLLWLALLLALTACPSNPTSDAGSGKTPAPPQDPAAAPLPTAESPPAEPIDVRSLAERQQAACRGADGSWRCKKVKPALAVGSTPVIPVSWTITNWWLDPQNVSTTASDSNDCVSAVTPCLTYGEIAMHRWGTTSPELQQFTVINDLSAWPSVAPLDSVTFEGRGGNVAFRSVLGATQTIVSGVLAGVVAKAPPNTLLQATLAAPTAIGQLIHNTTHDSYAYVLTALGGGNFEITQPVAQAPPAFFIGAENNSWTNGDAYTVYKPDRINVADLKTWSGSLPNIAFHDFNGVVGPTNATGGFTSTLLGCRVSTQVSMQAASLAGPITVGNGYINAAITSNPPRSGPPLVIINAGVIGGGAGTQGSFQYSNDVIFTAAISEWGGIATSPLWARNTLNIIDGTFTFNAPATFNGTSAISINKNGRVVWPTAQTAVNTFLTTASPPFFLNTGTTACSLVLGTGVWACGIPVDQAHLDAIAGVAGFGGNAIGPFGARINNAGN
jgi:hypothetical protein